MENSAWLLAVVLCAFLLQAYDISPVLQSKRMEHAQDAVYASKLQDEAWEELAKGRAHAVFVSNVTENQDILYNVSQYVWLHGMTVNDFYLAVCKRSFASHHDTGREQ